MVIDEKALEVAMGEITTEYNLRGIQVSETYYVEVSAVKKILRNVIQSATSQQPNNALGFPIPQTVDDLVVAPWPLPDSIRCDLRESIAAAYWRFSPESLAALLTAIRPLRQSAQPVNITKAAANLRIVSGAFLDLWDEELQTAAKVCAGTWGLKYAD